MAREASLKLLVTAVGQALSLHRAPASHPGTAARALALASHPPHSPPLPAAPPDRRPPPPAAPDAEGHGRQPDRRHLRGPRSAAPMRHSWLVAIPPLNFKLKYSTRPGHQSLLVRCTAYSAATTSSGSSKCLVCTGDTMACEPAGWVGGRPGGWVEKYWVKATFFEPHFSQALASGLSSG